MNLGELSLGELSAALRDNAALRAKQDIQPIARALGGRAGPSRNGDDCAALPDRDGFTLIAAEGMLPAFVQAEPFFAGFCAVMTNVSDIAAMGGRAQALVDVLFAGPDPLNTGAVLEGLAAGSDMFGVPIVGGHTARSSELPYLSAAIVGRAKRLITSFDARPGDQLLACIDLRGKFRGETTNFDAVSGADPRRVRAQLELLPQLAEAGLVHTGKDISNAGLVGTLLMLLETSGCGALLDLGALPAPAAASGETLRWLKAFPSFGYLLVARPEHAPDVVERFAAHGVDAAVVAELDASARLDLAYQGERARYWDLSHGRLLGFGSTDDRERHHA
jgi:AIR synthase-related protein